MTIGQRFARFVTDVVVRAPFLWRLFRRRMTRNFDQLAPEWDSTRVSRERLTPMIAALDATGAPTRALDVGTGTGAGAFALARRFPEAEIVGVDLAAAMVAEARRKAPPELAGRVRFVEADAARLPFADDEFELVALANMIPFFDELTRVLAPGGWAVFAFSLGAATPIYVEPERLRRELGRRGFADFADFSAGRGTALTARFG